MIINLNKIIIRHSMKLFLSALILDPTQSLAMEDYNDKGYPDNYSYRNYSNNTKINAPVTHPKHRLSLRETPREIIKENTKDTFFGYSSARTSIGPAIQLSLDPIVEDQDQLGTCSSFAVVECLKYSHKRSLSQPYMITQAEKLDNCKNDGLSIGVAMKVAQQRGVIGSYWWDYGTYHKTVLNYNKSHYPYSNEPNDKWDVCITPPFPQKEDETLGKFGFQEIKNLFSQNRDLCLKGGNCTVDKLQTIKTAISQQKVPVVLSVPVVWDLGWSSGSGDISLPYSNKKLDGWHAITVYGYDDIKQTFNFKNSWGPTWGNKGYGTLPYDYVERFSNEAWVGLGKTVRM